MTEVPDPYFSETALAPPEDATAALPPDKRGAGAVVWLFVRSRFLPALITLWLISVIVFASTHVLGINVARRVLGREATPEQLADFSKAHGLDKPIIDQYTSWLSDFVKGDWGISAASARPVSEIVMPRTVNTLILALSAIIIALPIAIAFGIFMARPGSRARELTLTIANVSVAAIPVFVIGIVLIYALSCGSGGRPSTAWGCRSARGRQGDGVHPPDSDAGDLPDPAHLPSHSVSVRETMTTPYARAAVLRGLTRRTITYRHLMPNAAGPIINVVALDLIWLIGGVIIVENVFGFPGLGTLLVESIGAGDLLVVQAVAMVFGVLFIGIGITADILVTLFNPRLRNG